VCGYRRKKRYQQPLGRRLVKILVNRSGGRYDIAAAEKRSTVDCSPGQLLFAVLVDRQPAVPDTGCPQLLQQFRVSIVLDIICFRPHSTHYITPLAIAIDNNQERRPAAHPCHSEAGGA